MKLFVFALCIVAAAALGDQQTRHCKSSTDCEEDECCVSYVFLHVFNKGVCKKLKLEGETCSVFKKNEEKKDVYPIMCPCKEGLKCESTHQLVVFGVVVKLSPECVSNATTTAVPDEVTIGNKDAE